MANPLSRGSHMVDLRAVLILPRLETLLSHSHVVTGNITFSILAGTGRGARCLAIVFFFFFFVWRGFRNPGNLCEIRPCPLSSDGLERSLRQGTWTPEVIYADRFISCFVKPVDLL